MQITITNPPTHSRNLLRRVGYALQAGQNREVSYVRRLSGGDYPRFHVYVTSEGQGVIEITLHLDEKKPSYEGYTAHSGQYKGEIVEQERERILAAIN